MPAPLAKAAGVDQRRPYMHRIIVFFALGLSSCAVSVSAPDASPDDARARQIVTSAPFKAAVAVFDRDHDRFVNELILLTEIPAPPFGEKARGETYLQMLREAGLEDVTMDSEGNVMGLRRGRGGAPLLAVAAHLDTVFPEGTNVKVKRAGTARRGRMP